jgi:ferritin-like metal-binding protein YciE
MLGMTRIESLKELFHEELKDIYDCELKLVDALEKMEESAHAPKLKQAFRSHRRETEGHVKRLEQLFESLGEPAERKHCKGIAGLLGEGKEFLRARGDLDAIDAAIIGAAQRVEHYEIAAYGTLRTFAQTLGLRDAARTLQQTLDEESAADEKLTDLATAGINEQAVDGEARQASRSSNGRSRKPNGRSRGSRSGNGRGTRSDGPTKEQLLRQARKLDIEGRSQMSKSELQRAVSRSSN